MRDRLNEDIKTAMKSGDKRRLATLRLVNAAIKDRDLGIGGDDRRAGSGEKLSEAEILALLQKMIKQRRESIETYRKAGRDDLAEQEAAEIAVIEEYLPKQMGAEETKVAVKAVMKDIGASGLKDMGRIMSALKERYTGRMDFAMASAIVKDTLK